MEFDVTNMNSKSNINQTFVIDKNGSKIYLFDQIIVTSNQGRKYLTQCKGFAVSRGELCITAMDNIFFDLNHIEKFERSCEVCEFNSYCNTKKDDPIGKYCNRFKFNNDL